MSNINQTQDLFAIDAMQDLDIGEAFNDRTSSIRIKRGVWEFYEHGNYNPLTLYGSGQSVVLGLGYYNLGLIMTKSLPSSV